MARRREPKWLTRLIVDAIHEDQLHEHGGLPGIRDENVLESTLSRPQQRWHYDKHADLPACAAAYAFGLARNHPYRDGNKRISFLAMVTFLGLNSWSFDATDAAVVTEFTALAAGTISEDHLADWIRAHSSRSRRS
jgi:death-on-curing protein